MRAVVCDRLGDPSVLKIEERPIPEPGPADVLIKVGAASVNFPDVLMLSAGYQHKPELPFVPGMEGAGTVEAVGAEVQDWRPGDRVIFGVRPGAFAEYVRVPASRQPDAPAGRAGRTPRAPPFASARHDRLPFAGPSRRGSSSAKCCWCTAPRAAWAWPPCSSASISARG